MFKVFKAFVSSRISDIQFRSLSTEAPKLVTRLAQTSDVQKLSSLTVNSLWGELKIPISKKQEVNSLNTALLQANKKVFVCVDEKPDFTIHGAVKLALKYNVTNLFKNRRNPKQWRQKKGIKTNSYVEWVVVSPLSRGKGIAQSLLLHAFEVAKEHDMKKVFAICGSKNRAVVKASRNVGLKVISNAKGKAPLSFWLERISKMIVKATKKKILIKESYYTI